MTSLLSSQQETCVYKLTYINNNYGLIQLFLLVINKFHNSYLQPAFPMLGNIIPLVTESADEENDYHVANGQEDDNEYYERYDRDDDVDNSNYMYIVNAILSGTARLNVLLPTATILVFTNFAPVLTSDGQCTTLDRWLMGLFVALLAASCVFFSFTDSFRTASGRLYYGVATVYGIRTLGGGRGRPLVPSDYRLRWCDLFHASLSLAAFLTFALLDNDVLSCYHLTLPRKFINTVPLMVGLVISVLLVLFPSTRRGIGYPFLLQSDAFDIEN